MIIIFIISLVIIIFLHELSHLIAAKLAGAKVEIISIGFGRPFYSFEYKKIIINITPILLGGYVKLKGELEETLDKDALINLSYRKKFIIAIAGCFTNIILGLLCLKISFIFDIFFLYYFGYLSITLGITNLIPIPCLDGGFIICIPIFLKIYGNKKGIKIYTKISKISFIILMILNIVCIPLFIKLIIYGKF